MRPHSSLLITFPTDGFICRGTNTNINNVELLHKVEAIHTHRVSGDRDES